MTKNRAGTVWMVVGGMSLFLSAGVGHAQEKAKYVGAETCKSCHEEISDHMAKTNHGKAKEFELSIKEKLGCEGCHGPGSLHAEAGGDKTQILEMKKLTAQETSKVCLTCHKTGSAMDWKGGPHAMGGLSCADCHSPHKGKAKLLTDKPNDLCLSCHAKQGAQIRLNSHHPVKEGKVGCADCHNPHSAANNNLKERTVNDLCYRCHLEKKGPWTFEHPPVSENCALCHDPHGTVNRSLLKVNQPFLCMQCHKEMADHISVEASSSTNKIKEDRKRWTRCTTCHSQLHGTNIPSQNGHGFIR